MDFALSEEQGMIFDMAKAFGEEHIAPFAQDWEAAGTIPKDLWPKAAELGFGGLYVGEDHGGSGLSRLDATLVFEALAMSCPAVGSFLSIHNMCGGMIDKFGSRTRPRRNGCRDALHHGEGVFLLPDGAGLGLRCRGAQDAGGIGPTRYYAQRHEAFISGGGYSDAYVTMVRTGEDGPKGISAVVVEDGAQGAELRRARGQDGLARAAHHAGAVRRLPYPLSNLHWRGRPWLRPTPWPGSMAGGSTSPQAFPWAAAQKALDLTLAYMAERKAFGRASTSFQALQFKLAEMEVKLQAARTFLRQAAWKLDTGAPRRDGKFCAMAKKCT